MEYEYPPGRPRTSVSDRSGSAELAGADADPVSQGPLFELPHPRLEGLFAVVVFLFASCCWLVALGLGIVAITALWPPGPGEPELVETALGLAVATAVQGVGMLVVVLVICRVWGRELRGALALLPFPRALRSVALVTGFAASLFSGWVAQVLVSQSPIFDEEHLDGLTQLLTAGSRPGRVALVVLVVLVAPVIEELIFRGFLWHALESALSPAIAWLLTTGLFCVYHLDLLHAVSILPTGLFLGWLRLRSSSVVPSILCHFAHNAMGVGLCLWVGGEFEASLTGVGLMAVVGVLLGGGICAQRLGSLQSGGRGGGSDVA